MRLRILLLMIGVWGSVGFISCGSSAPKNLSNRVMVSQSVSSATTFGELVIVDGQNDTVPRVRPIPAGVAPGVMAISPTRNIIAAIDSIGDAVYSANTVNQTSIGKVQLPGFSNSIVVPTANPIGYAAVPSATANGYTFVGAVEVMNLAGPIPSETIAVNNAQTVVSNSAGTQLLVFPPPQPVPTGSNTVTVLVPANAVPPVDLSCQTAPNSVCTLLSGFDRPVNAVINGSTAYVLNCGPECGGTQASVMILNLSTLTVTTVIPVDAATDAYLIGNTLYVAGTSPTNNACTNQTTAATTCGRLDVVDLTSNAVTGSYAITDGYHTRMDMSTNGQLFIGSMNCTEIGVGTYPPPATEVRGCLTILNTNTNALVFPPENGDVNGLQGFTTREVEYVAQGGNLYVYDTTIDALLINYILTEGIVEVVGNVGDVKAIDFF